MIKNKLIFTTKDAAEHLGYDYSYIRKLIFSGKLKAKKLGGIWLICPKDLSKIKPKKNK